VVDPKFLKGDVTLARAVGEDRRLVELNKLRLYQFTLRNVSAVHLQNAEIQFEFPAADVQDFASPRTALSKTALVRVDALPTEPTAFPTVFRWRIPHLPSGDSAEFAFQAVDSTSGRYEAALYNCDRVILERVEGEPAPTRNPKGWQVAAFAVGLVAGSTVLFYGINHVRPLDKLTVVREAGCDLRVLTSSVRYLPRPEVRVIQHRIFNVGQSCVVQSGELDPKGPFTIGAGDTVTRERLAQSRPKLIQTEVSLGATGTPLKKTLIPLFAEP